MVLSDTEKILYFGSNEVLLKKVPGKFINFQVDQYQIGNKIIKNQTNCKLIVPEIPARDIEIKHKEINNNSESCSNCKSNKFDVLSLNNNQIFQNNASTLENYIQLFEVPLMKNSQGLIKAFQSGIRSAVLLDNEIFYRLKGCGNNYEGFIHRELSNQDQTFEIRGCSFDFTSLRELWYSNLIMEKLLEERSWICGNKPLGYFSYKIESNDKINPCCGIFQTFGDRRLGDHVLLGIEMLLPMLVEDFNAQDVFTSQRFIDNEVVSTDMVVICEGEFGGIVNLSQSDSLKESYTKLRKKFTSTLIPKDYIENLIDEIEKGIKWIHNHPKGPKSLLSYIYYSLGHQISIIYHCLEKNDINWGTYSDALANMHCNAHPNNFIILPPKFSKNHQWIAPVDFDMSFERSTFIHSSEQFDQLRLTEISGLRIALSGMNLNSGAKGLNLESTYRSLLIALRDTLISGFESKNEFKLYEELEPAVHAIFQLALSLTSQDVC